jgi:hypothetical protein
METKILLDLIVPLSNEDVVERIKSVLPETYRVNDIKILESKNGVGHIGNMHITGGTESSSTSGSGSTSPAGSTEGGSTEEKQVTE